MYRKSVFVGPDDARQTHASRRRSVVRMAKKRRATSTRPAAAMAARLAMKAAAAAAEAAENEDDEDEDNSARDRGAGHENASTSTATMGTAELLRRLEESERVRDSLREALMTLKSRYESLELACGGTEALGRRGRAASASNGTESALERRTASEERLRRMRAEAEMERLKRATADVMRERAEREAEVSARLASGGLPGTARTADDATNAASAKELKSLRATCERQKKQIKELRDGIKALKAAGNRRTDETDALLPSSPARRMKKASSTAAPAKTKTTTDHRGQANHPKATAVTTASIPPSSLPDAGAESAEPPLPGADEQWTRRPPTLLAPLAPPRAPSSAAVAPTAPRPAPPPTTSQKRPATTHKRSGALKKLQKQTERTQRAFRLPK